MKKARFEDLKEIILTVMLAQFPFFGILVHQVRLVPDRTKSRGTAAVDGRAIYYDPEFMDRLCGESHDFVVAVLAHMVMHLALGHPWRGRGFDPERWNLACDIVINRILRECGIPLPPGALAPEDVGLSRDAAKLSEEEIYNLLPQQPQVSKKAVPGTNDIIRPDADRKREAGAAGRAGEQGGQQGAAGSDEDGREDAGAAETGEDTSGTGEEELWKQRALRAAAAAKMRGHLPDALARIVQHLSEPALDWRSLLAEFISAGAEDYDWRRCDRRLMGAYELYVPILHSEALEDVVIAVDTSGSISEEDLRQFLTESLEILRSYAVRGHFLTCDAAVHAVVDISDSTRAEELARALRGRGGTDFRPVFRWVEREGITPRVLAYFTDGDGTYPNTPPPYPVLWVLTEEGITPPWGKTVRFGK